jgi:hypothetical protein
MITRRSAPTPISEPLVSPDARRGFTTIEVACGVGVAVREDRVARYTLDRERLR